MRARAANIRALAVPARSPGALACACLALAWAGQAGAAEVEAAQRGTLFLEPSNVKGNAGITVVHPQTGVSATFASGIGIAAGYAVDVVSGVTPRVFGVHNDAIGRPLDAI